MVPRYFDDPYEFVPPYRGTLWCQVFQRMLPALLKRRDFVTRFEFRNLSSLRESVARGAGILIAGNHSRMADARVLGMLGIEIERYFYYIASWHLFKQERWKRFLLNRTGAFSIFREGPDPHVLRNAVSILEREDRPLVIFPEGTYFRQNDRLGPLYPGASFIARRAARKASRPIVVHPVAIKYWFLEDPMPRLKERVAALENRLFLRPRPDAPIETRLTAFLSSFLAVKEMEYLREVRGGSVTERIERLCDDLLCEIEWQHLGERRKGLIVHRVRHLVRLLVPTLPQLVNRPQERSATWQALERLWLCQLVYGHEPEYLEEHPSLERIAEAVWRIEEDFLGLDSDGKLAPMGAVVEVGEALPADRFPIKDRSAEDATDPLLAAIAERLQSMLDRTLRDGPPTTWHCPPASRPIPCRLEAQPSA